MDKFLDALLEVISYINDKILWGIPMILAILCTGILITVRTRALQVRKFGKAFSTTIVPTLKGIGKKGDKKSDGTKTISQFEAFSAAISGTVGTGNIVGVTSAIISGGPGAVFWMWVSAFFGIMTKYSENVLGLYFRKKDKDGEISGGPMYYISNGLGLKWLGIIFAFCCTLAATGMGMVQANSISGTLQTSIGGDNTVIRKVVAGIVAGVVVLLAALIIIGGIKRIGRVASFIVPFMTLLFIVMALTIIFMNVTAIPTAFALIFKGAFSFKSVAGGLLGYTIMTAMRYGFARGIFSNEAGLGSSVIAHSASETKEPVKQGLWGIFEVFFDTFIICTLTAVTLLTTAIKSGKYDFTNIAGNDGLNKNTLAMFAFTERFGTFGSVVFSVVLPLFAFTTILAWAYYGQKAIEFLAGKGSKVAANVFKVLYVGLLAVGALVSSDLVWALDDMFNAMMALPNLIALILMSGLIVKISKNYFDRKQGLDIEPMLSAYPDLNAELASKLTDED